MVGCDSIEIQFCQDRLAFDFVAIQDANLEKNGWPIDALQSDRAALLSSDAWRSFIFISLTFFTLWMFLKNQLKSLHVILILAVLIIADMWTVNKRYLNLIAIESSLHQ